MSDYGVNLGNYGQQLWIENPPAAVPQAPVQEGPNLGNYASQLRLDPQAPNPYAGQYDHLDPESAARTVVPPGPPAPDPLQAAPVAPEPVERDPAVDVIIGPSIEEPSGGVLINPWGEGVRPRIDEFPPEG